MQRNRHSKSSLFTDHLQSGKRLFLNKLSLALASPDWKQIEAILSKYPDLMFEKFELNKHGMNMTTSVVEYACFVRDKYSFAI